MSAATARARPAAALDGVLVVDKPTGPTSHDVVLAVRRITGERRIGHAGTLDPMASGVLVLALGRATRLVQFLAASRKTYEAEVIFGVETDTWDAMGTVVARRAVPGADAVTSEIHAPSCPDRWPAPDVLEHALARFRGSFDQVPPPFSAKKVAGARAYDLARRAEPVVLRPARVTVYALGGEATGPGSAALVLTCSPGFYVRSLAHDLGRALGCGAHLSALRRTASGAFGLADAVRLDDLTQPGVVARTLRPLEVLLPGWPAARLTAEGAGRVRHGAEVGPEALEEGAPEVDAAFEHGHGGRELPLDAGLPILVRLFAPDGLLLALARPSRPGLWPLRPAIVLR